MYKLLTSGHTQFVIDWDIISRTGANLTNTVLAAVSGRAELRLEAGLPVAGLVCGAKSKAEAAVSERAVASAAAVGEQHG